MCAQRKPENETENETQPGNGGKLDSLRGEQLRAPALPLPRVLAGEPRAPSEGGGSVSPFQNVSATTGAKSGSIPKRARTPPSLHLRVGFSGGVSG